MDQLKMMIEGVPATMVKSPTVKFLYGKLAADKNAFNDMESIDIVKAMFGVESNHPSTMDIVDSIVKNMEYQEQIAIRTAINERGTVGNIWNFVTPRMFMLVLSKEPLCNGAFEFTLTLVSKYVDGDETEVYVRSLVTFGPNGVRWQSPRLKHIEYNASSVTWLQQLHDEAMAKLEQNLSPTEPEPTTPPEEPKEPKCIGVEGDNAYFISLGNGVAQFRLGEIKTEITDPGFNEAFKYGKYKVKVALNEDDLKIGNISDFMSHFELAEKFVHWNGEPFTFKAGSRFYASKQKMMNLDDDDRTDNVRLEIPTDLEGVSDLLYFVDPAFENDYKYGKYVVEKDVTIMFSTHEQLVEVMKNSRYVDESITDKHLIFIKEGEVVDFSRSITDNDEVIIQHPQLFEVIVKFTNSDFAANYGVGLYRAKCDIYEEDFKNYEQLHELMEKFDYIEDPAPPLPEPPKEEEQPMNEPPTDVREPASVILEFSESCKVEENPEYVELVTHAANAIIDEVAEEGADEVVFTKKLREALESDTIRVKFVEKVGDTGFKFTVFEDEPPKPEVPSADIHNIEVQNALMRGMFGVTDPAITHVQKFLRQHLTAENHASFLATGTFPTETVIVYTEKPYDVTICILKFKDGAFYRIFLAQTNIGLTDHGYVATKDMPGRWVKVGRDIQDVSFRSMTRRKY